MVLLPAGHPGPRCSAATHARRRAAVPTASKHALAARPEHGQVRRVRIAMRRRAARAGGQALLVLLLQVLVLLLLVLLQVLVLLLLVLRLLMVVLLVLLHPMMALGELLMGVVQLMRLARERRHGRLTAFHLNARRRASGAAGKGPPWAAPSRRQGARLASRPLGAPPARPRPQMATPGRSRPARASARAAAKV